MNEAPTPNHQTDGPSKPVASEPGPIKLEIYEMRHNPRGICLIFNNEYFPANKNYNADRREGTEQDASRLHKIFTLLGFDVQIEKNKKAREILELAEKCMFSNRNCTAPFTSETP